MDVLRRPCRSRANEHVEFQERAGGLGGRLPKYDTVADHPVLDHRACACHAVAPDGRAGRHTTHSGTAPVRARLARSTAPKRSASTGDPDDIEAVGLDNSIAAFNSAER